MQRLAELRRRVDEIDEEIVRLLGRRLEITKQIAKLKAELNLSIDDAEREREVLENVSKAAKGKFDEEVVRRIFRLVIDCCKREASRAARA